MGMSAFIHTCNSEPRDTSKHCKTPRQLSQPQVGNRSCSIKLDELDVYADAQHNEKVSRTQLSPDSDIILQEPLELLE
jgi:hypothetical protein